MMPRKNIIIAGAGFGGITAALKLAKNIGPHKKDYEIILIDKHHHHLYTPALYEIAAIPKEVTPEAPLKSSILIPINDILRAKPVKFVCDEIIGLRASDNKLILKNSAEIEYEFLILALGSETNYFDIPGLKENSFPLKTYADAAKLRDIIENLVREKENIKIVVGGGGASGVELVAEFVNFICTLQKEILENRKSCAVEFMLLEADSEILGGFEPWALDKARSRLIRLGIKIKTNSVIGSVAPGTITLKSGTTESYDIFIWTGGVKGPEIFKNFGLPLSNKGALLIDEYLQIKNAGGHIFAIGDNSNFTNPRTGKPLLWNVPVAEAEGRLAAKNILLALSGLPPKKFSPLKKYPYILTVGGRYAIADLLFIKFSGFLGLAAKALVELKYLIFILPLRKALTIWFKAVKYYSAND